MGSMFSFFGCFFRADGEHLHEEHTLSSESQVHSQTTKRQPENPYKMETPISHFGYCMLEVPHKGAVPPMGQSWNFGEISECHL